MREVGAAEAALGLAGHRAEMTWTHLLREVEVIPYSSDEELVSGVAIATAP